HGVLSFGDSGVHEDAVRTQFHGNGSVGRGAYASVHDHGNFADALSQDAQVRGILNAHAGTDGSGQGHHRGGASIDQFASGDQIIVGVGQNDEALLHQDARGFNELLGVREKSLL